MKVLFLMISYPDVSKDNNMYTDLAQEFIQHGHSVFVIAPGFEKTEVRNESDATVLRIKTYRLFKTSFIRKGLANICLPFQYRHFFRKFFEKEIFDLVVAPTPPITFFDTIKWLRKEKKIKVYLILRDIFPQNARDLGIIRNPLIYSYFRHKEKRLYKIADSIGCMSPKNISYIKEHNPFLNSEKLHLLPNWLKIEDDSTGIDASLRSRYGLGNKFVLIFGGNFGVPQKLDFIVEVACELQRRNDILFLMVGDGTEKKRIKTIVQTKNIRNIIFSDHIKRSEFNELLKVCDVGMLTLSDKFTIPNIPSRMLSYWSVKLPVIAAIDKNTDLGTIISEAKGGLWSLTGDVNGYISNLLLLFENHQLRKEMGENGYKYLKQELNAKKAYSTIVSHL